MEIITRKIKVDKYDKIVFDYALCGYFVQSKIEQNNRYLVTFKRDLQGNSMQNIIKRVKEYKKYDIPSIIPIFVLSGVAVILFTIYIILALVKDGNSFQIGTFFSFFVPGILCFVLSAIYSFARTKKINDHINNGSKIQEAIKLEVLKEIEENDEKISN